MNGDRILTRQPGESRLEYLGRRAWALVGIGLVAWGFYLLFNRIQALFAPVIIAVVFGVVASPIVNRLQRAKVPRIVGTALVFLVMIAILGGIFYILVPPFARQIGGLANEIPASVEQGARSLDELQAKLDQSSPQAGRALRDFRLSLENRSRDVGEGLADSVFETVGTVLELIAALLIGSVVGFMTVKDLPDLTTGLQRWLAHPRNRRLGAALRSMKKTVTWYIRGQMLAALITGVAIGAALWALGIPYYLPLGALAAVGHLVPGIGPIVAGIPATVLALSTGGWTLALATVAALIAIQQLEAYLVSPRILGHAVDLHPISVIAALTVGGVLFGVIGVLVSVPVAAAMRDGLKWALYTPEELEAALAEAGEPAHVFAGT